ncbi:MAG: AAA family ATPase, partial [Myxococcota bacterium]
MPKHSPIINPQGKPPVGLSNFAKLAGGDYCFVDKSLFIKEVLDAGDDVILITRPRRFGKTMNMNMLHCFLRAPEVFAPKGSTKPQHNEKENQDLFDGLAISRAGEAYQLERGKRPVLFISFRTVKEMNWDDAWIRMRSLLSSLAQETSQGAPVDKLLPTKQRILQEMCAEKINPADCES